MTVSLADQAVASATSFLATLVVARASSPREFGIYVLGLSALNILYTLQEGAITGPYTIHGPSMKERLPQYNGSVLLHSLALAALATVALALAGGVMTASDRGARLGGVLLVLALAAGPILLRNLLRRLCFANLQFGRALLLDCSVGALQFLALGLLLMAGRLSASSAFVAVGLACALPSVFYIALSQPAPAFSGASAWLDFQRNLQTAKWLSLSTLLWVLALEAYPWIVAALRSPTETASFGVAIAVANALNALIAGLHNYVGPKIAHSHRDGRAAMRRSVFRLVVLSAVLVAAPCAVIALFRHDLIVLLYGDRYVDSSATLLVLLPGLLANALSFPLTRVFFALDRGELDLWINAVSLALFLPLGVVLVWLFGAFGAGLGILLTQAGAFLMRLVISVRMLGLSQDGPSKRS